MGRSSALGKSGSSELRYLVFWTLCFVAVVQLAVGSGQAFGVEALSGEERQPLRWQATDAVSITEIGSCDTVGCAVGLAVAGQYAYIADYGGGLRIVEITDPRHPREVGFVGPYSFPISAECVATSGSHVYVGNNEGGVSIVDVSSPTAPREVGWFRGDGTGQGLSMFGNLVYLAWGWGGLQVFDVSSLDNPTRVGKVSAVGLAWDVVIGQHGLLYVSDTDAGLRIIDASDPSHMTEAGSCRVSGSAYGVDVGAGYAYLVAYDRLCVISVSDPSAPVELGSCALPYPGDGVALGWPYAFVADHRSGMRVIDVSDPEHPAEVGFFDTPGVSDVAVAWPYIYLAACESGLRILMVEASPTPTPTGTATPSATSTRTPTAVPTPRSRSVYLPLMLKDYPAPLVVNGGFETGDWTGWQHGGDLPHGVAGGAEAVHGGRYALLLGQPAAEPCAAPSGQAWVEQEFDVPTSGAPRLSLWYRIFTYDRNRPDLVDTIDHLDAVLNNQRVLRAANLDSNRPPRCSGPPYDLGWQHFTWDLIPYRGQRARLTIVLRSTDRWWNTWAYVDDVQVIP